MTSTTTTTLATTRTSTATFVAAVKDCLRAVSKRPATPIMSTLQVQADPHNQMLIITGFDYEFSVTRYVDSVGEFGPVQVPGIALRDALARLDQKQDVYIGVDGEKVLLKQGTRSVTLKTLPIDQFPMVPPVNGPVFDTTGQVLTTFATTLGVCVGKDDMLPALTGFHLRLEGGDTLHGESTDRFRLAHIHRPVAGHVDDLDVLVPNLPAIAAVLAKSVNVEVHHDEKLGILAFKSDNAVITQRLLDGQFPKVQSLFPTDPIRVTTFEPLAFLSALKFVEAGVARNTAVTFATTAEGVVLSVDSDGDGEYRDTIPATVEGEEMETGFNPQFLAEAVKVFGKGHDVVMSSTQATKPSVFECESIPDLRILLMPRRLVA